MWSEAPVTTLDQTNPEVAIAYDTLLQVSKEVQSEGWTFKESITMSLQKITTTKYLYLIIYYK